MEVSQLYEQDFYAWAMKNAELLRQGRISEVDAMHLAEELEDMGKSNRRALLSRLQVLITHLLKYQRQPHLRSRSWEMTIRNRRDVIHDLLQESPSLRPSSMNQISWRKRIFEPCVRRWPKRVSRRMASPRVVLSP
jgi:uncharacterized protein DUF29